MKFNLLAGITLLMISNILSSAKAELIKDDQCRQVDRCLTTLKDTKNDTYREVGKPDDSSLISPKIVSPKIVKGEVSTISLTFVPKGNAANLKTTNSVAQIAPPTDSNGDRLFKTTRSGSSYLGVGANFGVSGTNNLGGTSLAFISKLGLTDSISARPSVLLLRDAATILIPITYDFAPQASLGNFNIAPYLGAGIAIDTGTDSRAGALLTGGVDIPLSSSFTANVAANLAFLRTTDFGILVGIGYNF